MTLPDINLMYVHWGLVAVWPIFAALYFANNRDKSLTFLVWAFLIGLSAVDVLTLMKAPRPASAGLIAEVAVVWGLLPPLYFYVEWFIWRRTGTEASRTAEFQSFKYAQDMGARVWSAVGIVLAFLAQLALSKPHA